MTFKIKELINFYEKLSAESSSASFVSGSTDNDNHCTIDNEMTDGLKGQVSKAQNDSCSVSSSFISNGEEISLEVKEHCKQKEHNSRLNNFSTAGEADLLNESIENLSKDFIDTTQKVGGKSFPIQFINNDSKTNDIKGSNKKFDINKYTLYKIIEEDNVTEENLEKAKYRKFLVSDINDKKIISYISKYDTEPSLYGKKWYSNDKDMGYKAHQKILSNSYELKIQYRFYTDVLLTEKLDEANLESPSKLNKYEEKKIFKYSQHMLRNYLNNNLKFPLKKKTKIAYDKFMHGQSLQGDDFYASPQIYELINYIKKNCKVINMFRVEGEKNVYEALARRIEDNPAEKIDFNKYDMFDLCSALKYHFREIKGGILTRQVTESLFHAFMNNKQGDLKELSKYLRGSLYGERIKFLAAVFSLYREVDKYKYYNMMGIDNLLICSFPSFFADVPIIPRKIEIITVMRILVESLIVELEAEYPASLIKETEDFFDREDVTNSRVKPGYLKYICYN